MLDESRLSEHLTRLGWVFEPHGERTFRSTHATAEGELSVFLRWNENWLFASVVPFLTTRGNNPFELSRWLLRMNRDTFQTKFAYDEDGDVVLSVEVPTESLDFDEVKTALDSLLNDAIRHRAMLRQASGGSERQGA